MDRVLRGERLYIHCWGGHGRTGTLVAVMLGRLYGLPYTTALRYTQVGRLSPPGLVHTAARGCEAALMLLVWAVSGAGVWPASGRMMVRHSRLGGWATGTPAGNPAGTAAWPACLPACMHACLHIVPKVRRLQLAEGPPA